MNTAQNAPLRPLPLSPHALLTALSHHINGLNPDQRQLVKQRYRPEIVAAMQELCALDPTQEAFARNLLPDFVWNDPPLMQPENGPDAEDCPRSFSDFTAPLFPFLMPTVAPSARRARGTPVSAPPLAAAPLYWACNRGLSPFPTSWHGALMLGALWFGIKGNEARMKRKQRQ